MWLLMRQCPLKHKECPLKRQLVGRVICSLEIQVAKATNRQKNDSVEGSSADDYTVAMETLGMKYGTKKMQRRATKIVNHTVP